MLNLVTLARPCIECKHRYIVPEYRVLADVLAPTAVLARKPAFAGMGVTFGIYGIYIVGALLIVMIMK